jgi:smad nuclear-interacting protein 1
MIDTPLPLRKAMLIFGQDSAVAGLIARHASISRQHAVLQFRRPRPDGRDGTEPAPWLMDLESRNQTHLCEPASGKFVPLQPARYYRLYNHDRFRLGQSSREYMIQSEAIVS